MPVAEALMTIEDYLAVPDDGRMYELVRGRRIPVRDLQQDTPGQQ